MVNFQWQSNVLFFKKKIYVQNFPGSTISAYGLSENGLMGEMLESVLLLFG